MVEYKEGNVCNTECDTFAIPVNCKGVMGAGLALWFKNNFPKFFTAYQKALRIKALYPGNPCLIKLDGVKVVMFPTKDDWKQDSSMQMIEDGLLAVRRSKELWKISSIAFPALGCGCGKLNWNDVKSLIEDIFEKDDLKVEVYLPHEKQ